MHRATALLVGLPRIPSNGWVAGRVWAGGWPWLCLSPSQHSTPYCSLNRRHGLSLLLLLLLLLLPLLLLLLLIPQVSADANFPHKFCHEAPSLAPSIRSLNLKLNLSTRHLPLSLLSRCTVHTCCLDRCSTHARLTYARNSVAAS